MNIFFRRPTGEHNLENGKISDKKLSLETGSTLNRKNTFQSIDCPLTNISVLSLRDTNSDYSSRKKVTKHNSMLHMSRRGTTKGGKESERRRKSVPAIPDLKARPTLSRNSSKWSLRRNNSAIDSQTSGIRWRPFPKEDERSDDELSSLDNKNLEDANLKNDFIYVNQAFVNSTPAGLPESGMVPNDDKGQSNERESDSEILESNDNSGIDKRLSPQDYEILRKF